MVRARLRPGSLTLRTCPFVVAIYPVVFVFLVFEVESDVNSLGYLEIGLRDMKLCANLRVVCIENVVLILDSVNLFCASHRSDFDDHIGQEPIRSLICIVLSMSTSKLPGKEWYSKAIV